MRLEQHTPANTGWFDLDQLVSEAYDLLEREPEASAEIDKTQVSQSGLDSEAAIQAAIISALGRSADPRALLEGLIAGMPPPTAAEIIVAPPEGEAQPGDGGDV